MVRVLGAYKTRGRGHKDKRLWQRHGEAHKQARVHTHCERHVRADDHQNPLRHSRGRRPGDVPALGHRLLLAYEHTGGCVPFN